MTSLTPQQVDAAQAFANATIAALQTDRGVHAETAIAATARMAGTFLFRSFDFPAQDLVPGHAVLSDVANEQGPPLVQLLGGVLSELGVELDAERFGEDIDPGNSPHREFLDTQKMLEPGYLAISRQHDLSGREAAIAGVIASAFLIHQCAQVLDPNIAFGVAVYGLIEGAKTAPDPVAL